MQQHVSTQILSRSGTLRNITQTSITCNRAVTACLSLRISGSHSVSVFQDYTMPNNSALDLVPIVPAWIPIP